MEVHVTPETAKKLNDLATTSGRAREDSVEDALAGYLEEVASAGRRIPMQRSKTTRSAHGDVNGSIPVLGTHLQSVTGIPVEVGIDHQSPFRTSAGRTRAARRAGVNEASPAAAVKMAAGTISATTSVVRV